MARRGKQSDLTLRIDRDSKPFPVVINAEFTIPDENLTQKAKIRWYTDFIKEQYTSHCLFSGDTIRVARYSGVSLASQIDDIARRYEISDAVMVEQFADHYYSARLEAGIVVEEVVTPLSEYDYGKAQVEGNVVALSRVEAAEEFAAESLDASLALKSSAVTRRHIFRPNEKAFSVAGLRHPNSQRRMFMFGVVILALIIGAYLVKAYFDRQEALERERRAAVIPPKIGKDDSIYQLREYGRWIESNVPYYYKHGASEIRVQGDIATITGFVIPRGWTEFYLAHKTKKILPRMEFSEEGSSSWTMQIPMNLSIKAADQFGLSMHADYITAMVASFERLDVQFGTGAALNNEYNITTGPVTVLFNRDIGKVKPFYDVANTMIGIPSFVETITIVFDRDLSTQTTTVNMTVTGRG